VLDDVAFRPFLEQPAGKIAAPLAVGRAAHVKLNERADLRRVFPGGGNFAGLQPDDGVADAQRLAGLHRQIAGQAVALVQQADHRHPLRHRGAEQAGAFATVDPCPRDSDGAGLITVGKIVPATAGWEHQQQRQDRPRRNANHDASGLHAS
jgi:hypothetical protein